MKYLFTFIWSFLLVTMLNYVVSSVQAVPFVFATGAIISLIVSVIILVIGSILPDEPVADHN